MPETIFSECDILIIGGGLAGLALAENLDAIGVDYLLVESRSRFGGRILSRSFGDTGFDLGPTWFWPGQPRMEALASRLGLELFTQFSEGEQIWEDRQGNCSRGRGYASMTGSLRIEGGMDAMISGLVNKLPSARLKTDAPVQSVQREDGHLSATVKHDDSELRIHAGTIVLALPPRIAADIIDWVPMLPQPAIRAMQAVPTWMAGQAKILALYDRPYWRDFGLSGDATSQRGPLVEIHDASPKVDGPFGLFGFVGVPADMRQGHYTELLSMAKHQLVNIFGDSLAEPIHFEMKDWAGEPFTSTALDQLPAAGHPLPGLPTELIDLWDNHLIFAGSEFGFRSAGYLEGALESAEHAYKRLLAANR